MNILLIEVIVLITIGWATTLYNWRRKWVRQQQAWQWWYQQQALQSHHTAESIRDGLLQQTFAFRRYLENIEESSQAKALTAPTTKQSDRWLNRFQTFYHSLETLSDELSPPFVADSLPLALQFILKSWQPDAKIIAPPDWPQSLPYQNQTILSMVTALLTVLIPNPRAKTSQSTRALSITLSSTGTLNSLTLKLDSDLDPSTSEILELTEIQYLKEIFHSLMAGQLEIEQEDTIITSHLHWPNAV